MPELPEVETLKAQLAQVLPGKIIKEIQICSQKNWQGDPQAASGFQIVDVSRRGKSLIIHLSKLETRNSKLSLVIHLKMTGQLIFEPHGEGDPSHLKHRLAGGHPTADFINQLPSKHTRVIIYFTDGSVLYFNDQRKFGWVKLIPTGQIDQVKFLDRLGPEPWDFTETKWQQIIHSSKKPIKLRLMDQEQISGIGNIYANDALWVAKIDPRRPASSLTPQESKNLRQAVIQVLEEGIKFGGATAQDGKYVDLKGLGGHYQEHFKAYQREGQPCLRHDGGTINRVSLGGRGTFWCPVCQK